MDFMRLTMASFQSYLGIVVHQSCSLMVELSRWHNYFKLSLVEDLSQRILLTLRVLCYLANLYANKLLKKLTQLTQKAVGLERHVTENISDWKQRNAARFATFASIVISQTSRFVVLFSWHSGNIFRRQRRKILRLFCDEVCHATPVKIRLEIRAIAVWRIIGDLFYFSVCFID